MRILVFTFFALFLLISPAKSQSGSIDASFGSGGKVTVLPQPLLSKGYGLAVQPDGKILLAGYVLFGSTHDFYLTRMLPEGIPDLSFGNNGSVQTAIGSDALCYAIALQADGKILLAGATTNAGGANDFAVVRYQTNGILDSTFSTDGIQTFSIASGDDAVRAIDLQPDGKIVVTGTAFSGNGSQMAVARLKTDGSLDPTFSGDGKATVGIGTFFTEAYDFALQPDGKIVVAGAAKFGMTDDIALARFLPNGSLDPDFGISGHISTDLGSDVDAANALALQPDGTILVAGTAGASRDFALLRYLENGTLDLSFGNQGSVKTDFWGSDDIANAIIVQPDGNILLGGYAYNGSLPDFALVRYLPNGTVDTGFGTNGLVTTDFDDSYDYAFPMTMQPDGKILLGGYSFSNGHTALAVARYLSGLNVGVVDVEQPARMLVAPNPVGRQAIFEFEIREQANYTLLLSDATGQVRQVFFAGQKLEPGQHTRSLVLDENLAAGCYFLQLSNGQRVFTVKVLKL